MQKSLFDVLEDQKQCTDCKEWKYRDQFHTDTYNKDGLRSYCKECKRRTDIAYNQTLAGKFRRYRESAKKRDYDFELTLEEFEILTVDRLCKYCNLSSAQAGRLVGGIDRVVNEIGYLFDNCVPCCVTCNLMKRHHLKEEFFNQVEAVYNHSVKPKKGRLMAFEVILTEDEIRVLQDALEEFTRLNAEGRCAVEYPIQKQKVEELMERLDGLL
tara:strand:- start:223 stop:861 length:639 start_codon:yes stop_codon:yes gene_type:complete